MILDTLQNRQLYQSLGPRFDLAFDALAHGIAQRADGAYELDGPGVRAIVQRYQTRPPEKCLWEAHRKFIDVQFIETGIEQIGWIPVDRLKSRGLYDEAKDVELFDGAGGDFLTLSAGMFAIFFPTDGHRPCVAIGQPCAVVKVVVKIAV